MNQIPETGPIVKISVSTCLFHPRQPRKGPQCSKFRNCPLTEANYKDPNIEHCQTSCGMYVGVFLHVRMCQWQVLWRTHYKYLQDMRVYPSRHPLLPPRGTASLFPPLLFMSSIHLLLSTHLPATAAISTPFLQSLTAGSLFRPQRSVFSLGPRLFFR